MTKTTTFSESNINIETNRSDLTINIYFSPDNQETYNMFGMVLYCTCNGSTQSATVYLPRGGGVSHSFTFTNIEHTGDGTKSVAWNWSCDTDTYILGVVTDSGTKELTTIPRASTITGTRAYIGEVSQLTINRKSDSFTHSIAYSFGGLSGYIKSDGTTSNTEQKMSTLSIGFTIPTTWYAQIPNAKEGICTLTIKTYSGNTQIGSSQQSTFYAVVNENTNKPTITASVIDTNSATTTLTGDNTYLVKGYSTARVTYTATAKNSASIASVKVNNMTASSSPFSFTFNDTSVYVQAVDSRSISNIIYPSFHLVNYIAPSVSISASRVSPTSNNIYVSFNGSFYNGNFKNTANTLTIAWKYRLRGATSWTNGGTLTQNTHYKISGNTFYSGTGSSAANITLSNVFTYSSNWEVGIFVNDRLVSNVISTAVITKGSPVINWGSDFLNVNGSYKQNGTEKKFVTPINNLTTATYSDTQALAANQGKALKDLIDTLTPVTIYDDATGKQSKSYITISNITQYKKLQITFSAYAPDGSNTGGASNIIWLDLTKSKAVSNRNLARCGVVIPYPDRPLEDSSVVVYEATFKAMFEADLTNNRLYCLFVYGTTIQTNSNYVMTKVVGYKY